MLRKEILFELLLLLFTINTMPIETTSTIAGLFQNQTINSNQSGDHFYENTTSYSDENGFYLYQVPWYMIAILSTLYGTLSILAVLGNGLIVWVVLKNKRMHNVTNYFISNLAMADIVIGLFATPFQFQAALLQYWVLPKIMCKVAPFATTLSVNVSIFTLVAISLDRYYVILYPLKPKLRVKQCFTILCFIWITALLLSSLHLYNYFVNTRDNELPRCEIINFTLFKYHVLILVLIQYVIPFIIITYTYFRIGYHIYFDTSPDAVNKRQEQNKRKVIKMIFIVVNLFMLCWAPLQLYNILNFIQPSINEYKYINILWFAANFFAMSNSCYNVFIYGVCSARYKREFRKVLSCLPCVDKSLIDYDMVTQNGNRRQTTFNKTQKSNSSFVRHYSTAATTLEDTQVILSKMKMRQNDASSSSMNNNNKNNKNKLNKESSTVIDDYESSFKVIKNRSKNSNNGNGGSSNSNSNEQKAQKKHIYTNLKILNNNRLFNRATDGNCNFNMSNKSHSFDEVAVCGGGSGSGRVHANGNEKYKSRSFNSQNTSDIDKQIQKFY